MTEQELDVIVRASEGISLITPDRLKNLARAAMQTNKVKGHIAELGVYTGGSARVLCRVCPKKQAYLFDTFSGLPYEELPEKNPTNHPLHEGRFACSMEAAQRFLEDFNVKFFPGVFPDSAKGLEDLEFAFVHIDCDLYKSARDAIKWFWKRMKLGSIMFFDDYGCDFIGVTDAVNEFFIPEEIEKQVEASNGIKIGALVRF